MPSTCSVSGNLQDLTGANLAGFAVFKLANYGSNVPRVIGTTVIASPQVTLQANGSGVISGNIWGNDNISPTGSIYIVTIEDANRVPIQAYAFSITGTTFNLNTAPAITSPATTASFAPLNLKGQTASISNTTIYTPPSDGLFRFSYNLIVSTGSGNSSTLAPAVAYAEPDSGATVGQGLAVCSAIVTNTTFSGSVLLHAQAHSAIQTSVVLNGPIGTGVYSYYARLEAL